MTERRRPRLGPDGRPLDKVSEATQRRAQSEAQFISQEELATFRAEHGGMSPLEVFLSRFPWLREAIERDSAKRRK